MQQVQHFIDRVRDSIRANFTDASDRRGGYPDDDRNHEDYPDDDDRADYDRASGDDMPYSYYDEGSRSSGFRLQARSLLIGAGVGLALGLLIGWVFFPVQWENMQLADLSEEAQANYLAAVADAYVARRDENAALVARQRLSALGADSAQEIAEAQQFLANSDIIDNGVRIQNLQELAQSLGLDGEVLAINRDLLTGGAGDAGGAGDSAGADVNANAGTEVAAERGLGARLGSWIRAILWLLFFAALLYFIIRAVQRLRERREDESDDEGKDESDDEGEDDQHFDDAFNNQYRNEYSRSQQPPNRYDSFDRSGDEEDAEDDQYAEDNRYEPTNNPLAFQPEPSDDSRSGRPIREDNRANGRRNGRGVDNGNGDRTIEGERDSYRWQGEAAPHGADAFQAEPANAARPPIRVVDYGSDEGGDDSDGDGEYDSEKYDSEEQVVDDDFDRVVDTPGHSDSDFDRDSGVDDADEFDNRTPARVIQPDKSARPIIIQQASEPVAAAPTQTRAANGRVVDEQRVHYRLGQTDFDESFPVMKEGEQAGGDYIGVYGVAPNEEFGLEPDNPELISTLQVWLHDKSEPEDSRGQVQLLVSRAIEETGLRQFFDAEDVERYQPLVAEPGLRFALETRSLRLDGEVEHVEYLARKEENNGIFRDVVINLTARQKA